MDIRTLLKDRLNTCSASDIQSMIEEGIQSQDEAVLPGLGYLFECYYGSLDQKKQKACCQTLSSLLKS